MKPMAATHGAIDFEVSLLEAPHVRVRVAGDGVALFDLHDGRRAETKRFASAPKHWQDFALRGLECEDSQQRFSSEDQKLEFKESALLAGASVTLVGELLHCAGGGFRLAPRNETLLPRGQGTTG